MKTISRKQYRSIDLCTHCLSSAIHSLIAECRMNGSIRFIFTFEHFNWFENVKYKFCCSHPINQAQTMNFNNVFFYLLSSIQFTCVYTQHIHKLNINTASCVFERVNSFFFVSEFLAFLFHTFSNTIYI